VVRIEVSTDAGEAALRRFDVRFTPSFVVFDARGSVVARTTVVGDAAARLRSLVATN
jgi:hypothetical protein